MKHFILIILSFYTGAIYAQIQPSFTNYIVCANGYNPAFAGSRDALAFAMLYRNQWAGIEGSPSYYFLTADAQLRNQKVALGAVLSSEEYGITKKQNMRFNYAYRIPVSRGLLSMGLGGGIALLTSRFSEIKTVDEGDRIFTHAKENHLLPAASAGLYYHTNRMFSGISIPELLVYTHNSGNKNAAITSTPQNYNYYLVAGYHPVYNENFRLLTSTLMKYQGQNGLSPEFTVFTIFPEVMAFGLSYRTDHALISMLRVDLSRQFKISYGYEYSSGALSQYGNGTHEIMLHYEFSYVIKAVNPRFR